MRSQKTIDPDALPLQGSSEFCSCNADNVQRDAVPLNLPIPIYDQAEQPSSTTPEPEDPGPSQNSAVKRRTRVAYWLAITHRELTGATRYNRRHAK